jgi:MYXO-CTERM domain-containing protein
MRTLAATAFLACIGFTAATAKAHFRLDAPAATHEQSAQGSPQKDPPCGGGVTPTNAVTAYQSGSTITITIEETIFHPGHYRIAIADDPSNLPAEPPVTAGNTDCGSVPIEDPPTFPVLADGVLVHTQPFDGPQTFTVELPSDYTCDDCTLQILEFMSDHGAPCFYYHCATVTVQSDPVGTTVGATTGGVTSTTGSGSPSSGPTSTSSGSGAGGEGGGGSGLDDGDDDGCGCRAPGSETDAGSTWALLALGAGALALGRRRRR